MNNIREIKNLIEQSKNIVVFTGAGISTSCGIPDFRGPNGLYNTIQSKYKLPFPEAIFEINYFKQNPLPFFKLTKEMFSENISPSLFHKYIAELEKEGKISIVVTQNIDMLHQKAGTNKILECHGTYETATCLLCKKKYTIKEIEPFLLKGEIPYCYCRGVIKPDIVFFGEKLPMPFYEILQNPPKSDLLIVAGTSLTVFPAASFPINYFNKVKSIIINKEQTAYDKYFDFVMNIETDDFVKLLSD